MYYIGSIDIKLKYGEFDEIGGNGPIINGIEYVREKDEVTPLPDLPPIEVGDTIELTSISNQTWVQGEVISVLEHNGSTAAVVVNGEMRVPTSRTLENVGTNYSKTIYGEVQGGNFCPHEDNPKWESTLWEGELTLEEAYHAYDSRRCKGVDKETLTPEEYHELYPHAQVPEIGSAWEYPGERRLAVIIPQNHELQEIPHDRLWNKKGTLHVKVDGEWHPLPYGETCVYIVAYKGIKIFWNLDCPSDSPIRELVSV